MMDNNLQENQGFVKIYRKFEDWEWYTDIPVKTLFLHLLLKANFVDKNWRGISIKRGERLTSILKLSSETGLTTKQVRNSIEKLIRTGEVGKVKTGRYTLIHLINYDEYQDRGNVRASKRARFGQGLGNVRAANNKDKEGREGREGIYSKKKFIAPSIDDVITFFEEKGYKKETAIKAFNFYDVSSWVDSRGKEIKNWKQKMIGVWFKEENKLIDRRKIDWKNLTFEEGKRLIETGDKVLITTLSQKNTKLYLKLLC